MTRKGIFDKIKSHLVIILAVICAFSFSLFMFTACDKGSDKGDITPPTYSKVENDDSIIKNGTFEFGTASTKPEDYPKTTAEGWTRSADNGATSSKVDSGIIDTSEKTWKSLLYTMYDDADFLAYIKYKFGYDTNRVSELVEEANPDVKSAEKDRLIKKMIIEDGYEDLNGTAVEPLIEKFANPGTHDDTTDTKVYMLNNYRTSTTIGFGTAQKLTSSSTFDLKAGELGKISFYVKTQDIADSLTGLNKAGVNVRLINKFNSSTQSPYVLHGIVSEGAWTQYTIYVKADDTYDCSLQVVLGLGIGNGNSTAGEDYTEGTAYFDDVVFTKFENEDAYKKDITGKDNPSTAELEGKSFITGIDYGNDTSVSNFININDSAYEGKKFVYDMNLDTNPTGYFENISLANVKKGLTKSNVSGGITVEDILGVPADVSGVSVSSDKITLTGIKNLAYNFTINSDQFKLKGESYALISFKIKNDLSAFDKNGITVYVNDFYGTEKTSTKVVSVAEKGDAVEYTVLVKNNFPQLDKEHKYLLERTFSISIYVGPSTLTADMKANDMATGNVEITDLKIAKGDGFEYARENVVVDGNGYVTSYDVSSTEKTDNYNLFTLLSAKASSTVSLFAGESANYTAPSSDSYNLSTAPSEYGTIVSAPASIAGYTGIESNHSYISEEYNNHKINTRSGNNVVGSRAGLINTKYINNYGITGLAEALNHTDSKDIQPLMIYNNTDDSYGYIGTSISAPASSSKLITLDVRVTGNAKAFIYLVGTSTANKDVLTIDLLSNTDGADYTELKNLGKKSLMLEITADMMDKTGEKQGWLTVSFYLATGSTAKDFRLEMWNGSRDGQQKSTGFVFINNITTSTTFTEPTYTNTFFKEGDLLFNANVKDSSLSENAVAYKRQLDAKEIAYNKNHSESEQVSYPAKYIWASNYSTVYAVYNSIDPVAIDPNAEHDHEDETTKEAQPQSAANFWMSFSSIVLAVVLVAAIVMLILKNVLARKKANKNDAKSYYKVSSRYKEEDKAVEKPKKAKKFIEQEEIDRAVEEYNATVESTAEEENVEIEEEVSEVTEDNSSLDEYVYGDVQTFDEDAIETNEDKND